MDLGREYGPRGPLCVARLLTLYPSNPLEPLTMSLEKIKRALVTASARVASPYFTIHSYRAGQWQLVASYYDAIATAETYTSFATKGTWGDCLEIRCDGMRVSL